MTSRTPMPDPALRPLLADSFHESTGNGPKKSQSKAKTPPPFSLRLSAEERTLLEQQAGNRPLGVYIREVLLGDKAHKRRQYRKPRVDDKKAAQLLAGLKSSRIAPNLNQIARAANCGNLDMSDEVREQLEQACAAVIAMRAALFIALGLKVPEDTP